MATPKGMKLYHAVVPGTDEHRAIVHAYYHLLQSERGVRAAEGIREEYGDNELTEFWEGHAIDHFLSYKMQISFIPGWESYLEERMSIHFQRRLQKMFRDRDDKSRKSYPRAEAGAKQMRRKLRARHN
jgi:hypothetical protein